jgi:5-methylcytosine-specific restriction endonuclease McrA
VSNLRNGHRSRSIKREFFQRCRAINARCVHCGQLIDYSAAPQSKDAFESDHRQPVKTHPHLAYVASNLQPSHASCNRSRGDRPMASTDWVPAEF